MKLIWWILALTAGIFIYHSVASSLLGTTAKHLADDMMTCISIVNFFMIIRIGMQLDMIREEMMSAYKDWYENSEIKRTDTVRRMIQTDI